MFPIRKNNVDFVQDYKILFPKIKITNNSTEKQLT